MMTRTCEKQCCHLKYTPLTLSYRKTARTFQGQSAGPGHPVDVIIVQPGTRRFEASCPDLFYILLSRASRTISTTPNHLDSAQKTHTHTQEMTYDRFTNLTICADGKAYNKVSDREKWLK